jgi:glycosyltransferase involved in cell wall biosynthesis
MCTYNGSRFLREQLESIAAQTKLPEELVICDDCSRDETVEIVREFAKNASFRVRLEVNAANLGSTRNFERAVRLCDGDIVALADQDDVWHQEKLSRMLQIFRRHEDIGAVFSDAELIDESSRPLPNSLWASAFFKAQEQDRFGRGQGLKVMLKHPVVTGATMAFRSNFRRLVLPIPIGQIHDYWIALLIASVSQLAAIREKLIRYRKHDAQQIGPGKIDSLWQQILVSKRADRDYLSEAERLNEIYNRLCDCRATFPPHPMALRLIPEKVSHQRLRGSLPGSKFLRLASLGREIVTLRYWRYSNGLGSVAKDFLIWRTRVQDGRSIAT